MKHWIKRSLIAVVGATLAIGALTACGHRHEGRGWQMSAEDQAKMRGRIIERVTSKLDLNADQQQKLGVLADKLQAQRTALAGTTKDPRAEVQALVAGNKFDRARAQALVSEKTAAIGTGSPEVIAALGDFYDSLNPAQQQKVRAMLEKGGRRWRG